MLPRVISPSRFLQVDLATMLLPVPIERYLRLIACGLSFFHKLKKATILLCRNLAAADGCQLNRSRVGVSCGVMESPQSVQYLASWKLWRRTLFPLRFRRRLLPPCHKCLPNGNKCRLYVPTCEACGSVIVGDKRLANLVDSDSEIIR
jgi:hypothetical protein